METGLFEVDTREVSVIQAPNYRKQSPTEIAGWLLLTTLWTLFLVAIPLLTEVGPDNYYANRPGWYTGSDVIRFIEPIGGLMLNFLVFHKSGILRKDLSTSELMCVATFIFGGAMYVQGAAFHSAAVTFKNSLQLQQGVDDEINHAIYFYMRTVWEHGVSHYVYAVGFTLMIGCQFWAYRELRYPAEEVTSLTRGLLFTSGILLSLLVLGVALQFPAGTIVGFIYLTMYGIMGVGGYLLYLYKERGEHEALTHFGYLVVPHHFFLGFVVAWIALILWIIVVGGFKSRSGQ